MKKYFLSLEVQSKQFGGSFENRVYYKLCRQFLLFFKKNVAVFSKDSIESFEIRKNVATGHLPLEFPNDESAILWFKLTYGG